MIARNILCDVGVSPASTLTQSEAALRQHQHGSFAKKYRQRQRLRAEKDTAEQKMRDAIEEHFAEEKKSVFNLRREGEGELCVLCESKIYGALHCNQMEELMHWGCAYARRKPVSSLKGKTISPHFQDWPLIVGQTEPAATTAEENIARHCQWLLWAPIIFCVGSAGTLVREAAPANTERKCKFQNPKEDHEGEAADDQLGASSALGVKTSMKWLTWGKTRDEVFGAGVDAWDESWAIHLIFDDGAPGMQTYLWNVLAKGKHVQHGSGVLVIPSAWKRRLRAKRRKSVLHRKFGGTVAEEKSCGTSSRRGGAKDASSSSGMEIPRAAGSMQLRGDVYAMNFADFKDRGVVVKGRVLTMRLQVSDHMPPLHREKLSDASYRSLKTNGDGACAMHSIWGRPNLHKELELPGARDKAVNAIRALPARAEECSVCLRYLEIIRGSLYNEFVRKYFEGNKSVERRIFWSSMEELCPVLAKETRQFYQQCVVREARQVAAKVEALSASREFFVLSQEQAVVRPLAVRLGFVPAGAGLEGNPDEWEGFGSAASVDGFVRGTRQRFPPDGPASKYAALFDRRPIFDGIREAFLIYLDAESTPKTFYKLLQDSRYTDHPQGFVDKVSQWCQFCQVQYEPTDFGFRAWNAYLKSIGAGNYYFSIDEVVGISVSVQANVAIFEERIDTTDLVFAGGCFGGSGDLACIKLLIQGGGEVRSHFEHLVATDVLNEFQSEVAAQKEAEALREAADEFARKHAAEELAKLSQEAAWSSGEESPSSDVSMHPSPTPEPPPPIQPPEPSPLPGQPIAPALPPSPPLPDTLSQKANDERVKRRRLSLSKPGGSQRPAGTGDKKVKQQTGSESPFLFVVRCLAQEQSPDPRSELEVALSELASAIRQDPTVPADPDHNEGPLKAVFDDNQAVLLPPKHCAFKGCMWCLGWGKM